jgi:arylsulfatase A-like enzyme
LQVFRQPDSIPILTRRFGDHLGYAVRQGNWKLVSGDENWELYDLESDRTELHDLAPEFPERVEKMIRMWEEWAVRVNVAL